MIITLTVRLTGHNKCRLVVTYQDSLAYFDERDNQVTLLLNNIEVLTHTTCGPPLH